MNLEELRCRLIAAARAARVDERVPYGFEKRIMARLKRQAPFDIWGAWARALWRATAPCVAVALLFGAWSLFSASTNSPGPGNGGFDVAQEFENTLLAAADQDTSIDSLR